MSQPSIENPRLTRRLKRALLATLFAVLILATITAAVTAYLEASDIQDETLVSVARLVESNQMDTASDADIFDDDGVDDSAVRVWEAGAKHRHGINLKKDLKRGFHTLHEDGDFWRIYVTRKNRNEKQFIVAQKLAVSAELALNSAKNTAIPLLLLFLSIPLLVTFIVKHSFKPLNDLTRKIGNSKSLRLDIEEKKEIPVEIMPFVSTIDSLLEKNEAYNQRQRRFIADAAHELRTPITALSLEIENVRSAKDDDSRIERQTAIAQSVSRLQRLVNQLLDLARAQSISNSSNTTVQLNELLKSQIADLYPLAEQKDLQLNVLENHPVLLADNNNQLQHLVRNALSNAIKFTPEAGNIDIRIYRDGEDAVFTVRDNGQGADSKILEKLDQPFFRPDGQASGNGAGLGLAICREIATLLNGELRLENVEPTGFMFTYRQPVAEPA